MPGDAEQEVVSGDVSRDTPAGVCGGGGGGGVPGDRVRGQGSEPVSVATASISHPSPQVVKQNLNHTSKESHFPSFLLSCPPSLPISLSLSLSLSSPASQKDELSVCADPRETLHQNWVRARDVVLMGEYLSLSLSPLHV